MKDIYEFLDNCEYSAYTISGASVIVNSNKKVAIRLDICNDYVIRVWSSGNGAFEKEASYSVEDEQFDFTGFTVNDKGDYIQVLTKAVSIRIQKSGLSIFYYKADDKTLITAQSNQKGMGFGENGEFILRHCLGAEEHIYGLGEDNDADLGNLDRKGSSRDMITGQRIQKGRVTADFPIPFFMSTGFNNLSGGYGMFIDNSYHLEFDMGKAEQDNYYIASPGGDFLYYFLYGPSFKEILQRYTDLTGKPSMLNKWTCGYIQSKCTFYDWDEIDDAIYQMNEKQIPMDCIVIDADWPQDIIDFQWHKRWKGQSREKIQYYKEKHGIKFMLSTSGPMIKKSCSNFQSGLDAGIFATDGKGNTVTCGYYGGELMDFTVPQIKDWLKPQMKPLFDDGIDAWWLDLDEPEGEPVQTVYKGGPREKIRNIFPNLNIKVYHEIHKEFDETSRPFILSRTGAAGCQKYGAALWTGDVYCDYETLQAHCAEALNTCLSGMPYWTCDTGGFISSTYDTSSGSHNHMYKNDMALQGLLFQRWMQFTCFAPITRSHHVGPPLPYQYGAQVESSNKHYLSLRYQLLPYVYSYAYETHKTGLPLMRALVLEYQNDPHVYALKDQFLFGKEILVAPVLTENTNTREVYFPEGVWIDYDYGYEYKGGKTYTVYAPADRIPLFIKLGSIIPMIQKNLRAGEQKWNTVILDIYPDEHEEARFQIYNDDGKTTDFETKSDFTLTDITCKENEDGVSIAISESNKKFAPSENYMFKVHVSRLCKTIQADGREIPQVASQFLLENCEEGYFWDKFRNIAIIKIKASENSLHYDISIAYANDAKADLKRPTPPAFANGSSSQLVLDEKAGQLPYLIPAPYLPTLIQAENYDRGGEGVAYHKESTGTKNTVFRNDDIALRPSLDGGGYDVVGLCMGEWIEYSIFAPEAGHFDISLRVVCESENAAVQVCLDGEVKTGSIKMAHIGKNVWQNASRENVWIEEGQQVMQLYVEEGCVSLHNIEIKRS